MRRRLAAEPGALLAVYQPAGPHLLYPIYRLLIKRVVSINTTAAGGNTSLMMLGS